jgi:uncharacterized protein (DUF849 family)
VEEGRNRQSQGEFHRSNFEIVETLQAVYRRRGLEIRVLDEFRGLIDLKEESLQ